MITINLSYIGSCVLFWSLIFFYLFLTPIWVLVLRLYLVFLPQQAPLSTLQEAQNMYLFKKQTTIKNILSTHYSKFEIIIVDLVK